MSRFTPDAVKGSQPRMQYQALTAQKRSLEFALPVIRDTRPRTLPAAFQPLFGSLGQRFINPTTTNTGTYTYILSRILVLVIDVKI